jgi:hypothetical protein
MVINIVIIKMIKKTLSYHSTPLKLHISFRTQDVPELDPKGIPLGCACASEGMCFGFSRAYPP